MKPDYMPPPLLPLPPPLPLLSLNAIRECVHCIGFKVLVNRHDYGRIVFAHA